MSQKSGKLEKDINSSSANRLLVICVDRDNDVGEKAGISTPVVGRDSCIEAAQRLALEDPEDADSNSIFSAIKTYEDLVSKGYQVEVITVGGTKNRGVEADEKIASEIKTVLQKFSANGAVIVSDGEDDESVIPVIQNVLPVISVQRVVMKVSRSVEYSYAVFGKYLKMIAYDSKYSKFFLGVPGILLLIGGIATVFGYTAEIFAVLVSILGGAFVIRAFDIDRAWTNWAKPTPSGFVRMFTMVAGVILILSSIPAGISVVDTSIVNPDAQLLSFVTNQVLVGQFVSGALPILWVGIGTVFAGTLMSNWLGRIQRQISDILRLVVLGSLYPTVSQFTNILIYDESSFTLIPPLLAGLGVTLVSAFILFKRYRKQKDQEMDSEQV
jgi:putative membrane protein